jgi:hypothetical protein
VGVASGGVNIFCRQARIKIPKEDQHVEGKGLVSSENFLSIEKN